MTNQTKTRDSFIFYRSFFHATKKLTKDDKAELFDAICTYALDGELVEMSAIPDAIFSVIQPNLDANRRRWENGCKEKKKNNNKQKMSKDEAKDEQKMSKSEGNKDKDKDVNENLNEESKSELESQFESFWRLYNKKIAKADAEKKFKLALKKESYENIIDGVGRYIKSRASDKKYWKNPSTWLYQECWNDEYEDTKEKSPNQESLVSRFNKFMGYEFACKVEEDNAQAIVQLRADHFKLQIDGDDSLQDKIKDFFKNKEVKFTW